jgi:long-chain acyl-CoA synthetase
MSFDIDYNKPTVVLTGITGTVGSMVGAALLRRGWNVIALARGPRGNRDDQVMAEQRVRDKLRLVMPTRLEDAPGKLWVIAGDLTSDPFKSDPIWNYVGRKTQFVVHIGGDVGFDRPLERSMAVNYGGTEAILEWAKTSCPLLLQFVHISTAYVAGRRVGEVYETMRPGWDFRTTYEDSKARAENLLWSAIEQRFPATIIRPSIIGPDQWTGFTSGWDVFYGPLEFLATGQISAVPAEASSWFDVVPLDHVVAGILRVLDNKDAIGRAFHLAAGASSVSVGEFVKAAASALDVKMPALLHPLQLVDHQPESPEEAKVLEQIRGVYLPYVLGVGHRFSTIDTQRILGLPDPHSWLTYCPRAIAYAIASKWGANSASDQVPYSDWLRANSVLAHSPSLRI